MTKIAMPRIRKAGERRWEATFLTDQVADDGHREITLVASHTEGVYVVRASIATSIQKNGYAVTVGHLFQDPVVTVSRERARFSQKRLREMFDAALDGFDSETFYAAYEVASA